MSDERASRRTTGQHKGESASKHDGSLRVLEAVILAQARRYLVQPRRVGQLLRAVEDHRAVLAALLVAALERERHAALHVAQPQHHPRDCPHTKRARARWTSQSAALVRGW